MSNEKLIIKHHGKETGKTYYLISLKSIGTESNSAVDTVC